MALLYANENFPAQVVGRLKTLGHDVLTSLEAGRANLRIPDAEVLAFAASQQRALLTHNRRDFLKLHHSKQIQHYGIILCTADQDFAGLAQRIHEGILKAPLTQSCVLRINRPCQP